MLRARATLDAMAYRDGFERCPRCHVALEDARAARGCRECGGLWLDEPTLTEMLQTMVPSRPLDRLALAMRRPSEAVLGCPTCSQPMQAVAIRGVSLDRCAKHGIWFDARELERTLQRVAVSGPEQPAMSEREATLAVINEMVEEAERAARLRDSEPPRDAFVFVITNAFGEQSEVTVQGSSVRIGSDPDAEVRIVGDRRMERMHVLFEVTARGKVVLYDTGPPLGITVNGKPVGGVPRRTTIRAGDRLTVGYTDIEVRAVPRR